MLRIIRPQINVGTLSSEVSWALFKRHSLENRYADEHPELEEVGKQIADKCKGLPLALKALAGILRSKSEVDEWRDILRSEIWELPSGSNGILPALMLSYNDLPAHLKQCFAYCAIYPKDYQFCKDQVIHLWIANGLAQQLHSGCQYFLELRSRSLFERVPKSSKRDVEEFLMHDLVNDLAQMASSKLCIRLEENEGSHMLEQSRHMSYSMGEGGDFEKLKSLSESKQLRTLLPINIQLLYKSPKLSKRALHNILPRLTSLRALSLSRYRIVELPNDLFIKLKFLRFLDLSWTEISKLPNSICVLYNLETLLLSSCTHLKGLPTQFEKLINLRHLDISNSYPLNMALHLSKLKSLQVLVGAKFLLGGSRMDDLGELHNLYGSLKILELQNVVDRREALKAKMREKNHVEKLSLEWSGRVADNSQTERGILDELRPHTNIEELEINGYRGTQFPNWLADHSYLKLLVQLSLSNGKDCYTLPALGQLPSLQFLFIRGMHGITDVTEEFYGNLPSQKPFNFLEKLEFEEMPEWKNWHVLGNGEFPTLQKLSIKNCPKLMGRLPENLCSLIELTISKCPEINLEAPIQLSSLKKFVVDGSPKVGVLFDDAELFTSQLQGMKQIDELCISDCNSLTSLPISILLSTLKRIKISGCRKLKLVAPVCEMISSGYCNMFLEDLRLVDCDSIDDISSELVPRTRNLRVDRFHKLTRFLIPTWTENLGIWDCENLEILSVACGTQMTFLEIRNCKKLKQLPERMQEFLPSLNTLRLFRCPEIESFPEGGLPFNLQVLEIRNCKKLVNSRKEWHLERLPCLRQLSIVHDGSDEEIVADENWELPCSIRSLTIWGLKTLSSQVVKSLTSLEYLDIVSSPKIQSLLEEGLPSSLRTLYISYCYQLQSLALPSSLSELHIWDCPNLQSLPVKGMPSSLSELYIRKCPLLEPLLEFDKGEYWPKIAHISTIVIDYECL